MRALILPVLICLWAAYQTARALRRGVSDDYKIFRRSKEPLNFWLYVTLLPIVAAVMPAMAIGTHLRGQPGRGPR